MKPLRISLFCNFIALIAIVSLIMLNGITKSESFKKGYSEVITSYENLPLEDIRKVIILSRDTMIVIPNKFYNESNTLETSKRNRK